MKYLRGWKTYFFALALVAAAAALAFEGRLSLGWTMALIGIGMISVGLRHAISHELEKLAGRIRHGGGQVERR